MTPIFYNEKPHMSIRSANFWRQMHSNMSSKVCLVTVHAVHADHRIDNCMNNGHQKKIPSSRNVYLSWW